ncbi:MAG: divergent polysaccharide deacetylase family protein [Treponema sp.]|nr:divergent polysaccharide deacetylase family protein [Treponema sp.]
MPDSSPKRTQKSITTRKSSPAKKRTATRRAKKPKVVLAKSRVAMLCGLICGICVIAIGLSIALNPQEERKPQKTALVAKTAEPKTPVPKAPAPKMSAPQKVSSETVKTQPLKAQPEKTQPVKAPKTESVTQKTSSVPKAKVTPQEVKGTNVVKRIPANQAPVVRSAAPQNKNSQLASVRPPKELEMIQQHVPKNRFNIPQAENGATIVIVIDDAGRSVENTKKYASLPFPITIAVLPKLPQTRACAEAIRASGKELILHQPMQSMNLSLDPGPGKITADMNSYQIASIVKENLLELGPGVRGMNNHEGSLITSNEIKIGAVLEVCAEKGIYFFDSRTTADTKAPQAALERDMKIFEKAGPYLDNDIDRAKMLERIMETLAYANRHGKALVIGHVDKSVKILPDLLSEMYPEMRAAGYRFATPSMLR